MNVQPDFVQLDARCQSCAALAQGLCAAISRDQLRIFVSLTETKSLAVGDELVAQDEQAKISGIVRSGVLKFTRVLADGREFISQFLFPGDLFWLADGYASGFALTAATRSEVCVLDGGAFLSLADSDHGTCHAMLSAVGQELENVEDWIVKMGTAPVSERIAFLLLLLWFRAIRRNQNVGEATQITIELPVPRRDIATFLGTSVESLSRQLQYFARSGVIRILNSRQFVIRSPELLSEMAGA